MDFYRLNVQFCVLGVGLNEAAAGLDLISHQDRECLVGLFGVLNGDADDDAVLGVHGGLPQLLGVHLTKAFVAVDLGAGHFLGKDSHFGVIVGVLDGVAFLHLEQGRLGNIHMALLNEGRI